MSHILHLGHQVTDLAGVEGRISADAAGFDADLDETDMFVFVKYRGYDPVGHFKFPDLKSGMFFLQLIGV